MNLQPIFNIAEICARHQIKQVVLSPGSRCAPLIIAFARHPEIEVRTIPDERAAAFIGLGMAQYTGKATVLVCTSGTATLNYAPAVAEAFYQQVPLLLLTADRPSEWVNQQDGQTIRQQHIYGQHIKASFDFPADLDHPDAQWYASRLVSEALNEAHAYPPGPVHINVPLREPFYPAKNTNISYDKNIKIIEEVEAEYSISEKQVINLKSELNTFSRILILVGQHPFNQTLIEAIQAFREAHSCVVVGDVISNIYTLPQVISFQDIILGGNQEAALLALKPDLVISFGNSIISKSLKLFLRKYKPQAHWQVQPAGPVSDTFQSLTRIIRSQPDTFFKALSTDAKEKTVTTYMQQWQKANATARFFLEDYFKDKEFSEFQAYAIILQALPNNSLLHLANSMAVRYANILGLEPHKNISVFANRGTSGIDGSTSTAVGTALLIDKLVTLLTGDMAFFYDRNALWHNYLPQNLRIIIFNNHGGGIFRLIDGPRNQPELDEYFETQQVLKAENTARDFKMHYFSCYNLADLQATLPSFWQSGPGILEIFTSSQVNAKIFSYYKNNSPFK